MRRRLLILSWALVIASASVCGAAPAASPPPNRAILYLEPTIAVGKHRVDVADLRQDMGNAGIAVVEVPSEATLFLTVWQDSKGFHAELRGSDGVMVWGGSALTQDGLVKGISRYLRKRRMAQGPAVAPSPPVQPVSATSGSVGTARRPAASVSNGPERGGSARARSAAGSAVGVFSGHRRLPMRYEAQRAAQTELDARVPRGPRGSAQNAFRGVVYDLLLEGYSFDESVAKATDLTRKNYPGFSPTVKPQPAR